MKSSFFGHLGRAGGSVWRRTAPGLLAVAAAAALALPNGARADGSIVNKAPVISGPVQVYLVYPDPSGNQQDVDLANVQQSVVGALPADLQSLRGSALLTSPLEVAFGQLWSTLQDQDCGSVTADIQRLMWGPELKGFSSCSFGASTQLTANQQTQWPVPGTYPVDYASGQRLLLDYTVPYNTVVLRAASGNTTGEDEQPHPALLMVADHNWPAMTRKAWVSSWTLAQCK
jgi:hypothetical protein